MIRPTLTLAADLIERDLYLGRDLAGTIVQRAPRGPWAAFDAEGQALGTFDTADAAGAAVLAAFAARRNAGGA